MMVNSKIKNLYYLHVIFLSEKEGYLEYKNMIIFCIDPYTQKHVQLQVARSLRVSLLTVLFLGEFDYGYFNVIVFSPKYFYNSKQINNGEFSPL